jgi:TRAP-type C4-dicarboxylate transport system permease small subunit
MADVKLPVEAGGGGDRPESWLTRVTGMVAVFGGLLALTVAILVTTSVFGRWLFNAPIDGDFEFVKMATAVAVFAYLPYTQARRGNIMVDTFWDLIYALSMLALTIALFVGTMDSIRSGETTMQRQILLWPSIGLSMVLCGLLAVSAFATAQQLKASTTGIRS